MDFANSGSTTSIPFRSFGVIGCLLFLSVPAATWGQERASDQAPSPTGFVSEMETKALATGNGRSAETAFVVEGVLWEYRILDRLHLRFQRQRSMVEGDHVFDIITARAVTDGAVQDVWFRVAPDTSRGPEQVPGERRYDPETDAIVRSIFTSGDGRTPETAFVVGGRIMAEYEVLRIMGLESAQQALVTIRGCSFDVQYAHEPGSDDTQRVYFKLGRDSLEPGGPCVLAPDGAR